MLSPPAPGKRGVSRPAQALCIPSPVCIPHELFPLGAAEQSLHPQLPSSGSLRSPGTKPFPVQHWLFTPHTELPTNRQPKSMLCLVNNYYNNLQEFLPTSVDLSLLQMSSAVRGIPEAPGSCTRSCGCSCEKENKLPHVEKHLLLKCQTPHCTSSCSSQQMRFPLPTWAGALSQALFSGYSCTLQKGLSSEGAAI